MGEMIEEIRKAVIEGRGSEFDEKIKKNAIVESFLRRFLVHFATDSYWPNNAKADFDEF